MSSQSIDAEIESLFASALRQALDDEETKDSLEGLAAGGLDVSIEKVRADVEAMSAVVLERVQTMRDGWLVAEERLDEVLMDRRQRFRDAFEWRLIIAIAALAMITFFPLLLPVPVPAPVRLLSLALIVVPLFPIYARLFSVFLLSRAVMARSRARAEARDRAFAALETQTTVAIREAVNRRLTSFATEFRIFDRRGLRQLADPDREVSTIAAAQLDELIASLDSGSIGLSGPRGCGKTTLIRSFTEGGSRPFNKERIGFTVAAPVKYDAREFVLHLFASLCERVLRDRPYALAASGSRWTRAWRRKMTIRLALTATGLIAAGLVLLLHPHLPDGKTIGAFALFFGFFAAYGAFIMWFETTGAARSFNKWLVERLGIVSIDRPTRGIAERAARDYLKQIRFQQSQEAGRAAEISFPFGLNLGGSSSTTLARTPWTLPEAVAEFRRFAAALSDRFVVIGIDELDKMESDKAAREFLNNVKGVFGVAGCYYLVSVSEDAMAAFERRGLPLRDVFDSSFDEIQQVGYLDLDQSRLVLESRVTGLPVPFQCLCHCLAGGLPRDLIRVTRELVHHHDVAEADGDQDGSITALASSLMETEWRGKLVGAIAAVRSAEVQPWWLTRWLHTQTQEELDDEALRERTLELSNQVRGAAADKDEDEDARKAQRIAIEMMVFNYYAATVIELFGSGYLRRRLQMSSQRKALDPEVAATVETLAMARQQFSVDPWLAWGLIGETRKQAELSPWDNLRAALLEEESAAGAAAAPVG